MFGASLGMGFHGGGCASCNAQALCRIIDRYIVAERGDGLVAHNRID